MSTLLTIIHFSKRCDYSPGVTLTPIHQRPNSLSRVTPDATAFHQVLKLIRDREYCREGEGKREKERTQKSFVVGLVAYIHKTRAQIINYIFSCTFL